MISELNRSARASSDLVRFALLFSVLYSAFGVASPFLPMFLSSRTISPEQIGLIISLSTFVRIVSGPIAGRMADRLGARREILAVCTFGAAVFALAFLPAHGFSLLLVIARPGRIACADHDARGCTGTAQRLCKRERLRALRIWLGPRRPPTNFRSGSKSR
jgi:MFS family permease